MEALIARNPKDPHYGTGYDLECQHCGRLFTTEDKLQVGGPCPDDECPSHWELIGLPYTD